MLTTIHIYPSDKYGKLSKQGIHHIVDSIHDIYNARDKADRDMFDIIYLYTNDERLIAEIYEHFKDFEDSGELYTFEIREHFENSPRY